MVQSLRRSKSFRILFNSPELVEEQRSGFHHFLKHGITEELSKISFLEVKRQNVDIEVFLDAENFQLISPDDNSRNCVIKMKTYACKLYVQIRIVWKNKSGDILMQTEPEWVLLAHLPMMTKRGHFVINGSPRVIVHQVVRAPGVYFQKFGKVKKDERNKARFYGDIIPRKGVWVRLQISKTGQVEIKLKKSTKVQAEMVERCLAYIEKQELSKRLPRQRRGAPQSVASQRLWFLGPTGLGLAPSSPSKAFGWTSETRGKPLFPPEKENGNVLPTSSQYKPIFPPPSLTPFIAQPTAEHGQPDQSFGQTNRLLSGSTFRLNGRLLTRQAKGSSSETSKMYGTLVRKNRTVPFDRSHSPKASKKLSTRKFVGQLSNSVRHNILHKRVAGPTFRLPVLSCRLNKKEGQSVLELSQQHQLDHSLAWIRKAFALLLGCFEDFGANSEPQIPLRGVTGVYGTPCSAKVSSRQFCLLWPAGRLAEQGVESGTRVTVAGKLERSSSDNRTFENLATLRTQNVVPVLAGLQERTLVKQAHSSKILAFGCSARRPAGQSNRKFGASRLEGTDLELAYSALGDTQTRTELECTCFGSSGSNKSSANRNVLPGRSCSDTQSKIKKGSSVKEKATRELANCLALGRSDKLSKQRNKFNQNYCSRSQFMAITGISKPFLELGAVRSRAIPLDLRRPPEGLTWTRKVQAQTQMAQKLKTLQSTSLGKQQLPEQSYENLRQNNKVGTDRTVTSPLLIDQPKSEHAKVCALLRRALQQSSGEIQPIGEKLSFRSLLLALAYRPSLPRLLTRQTRDRVRAGKSVRKGVDTLKPTKSRVFPKRLAPLNSRLRRHSINVFDNGIATTSCQTSTQQSLARKEFSEKFAKGELKGDDRAFTNVYDNLYRVPEMKELEEKMSPKGSSIPLDTEFKRNFSYKHIFATFKAPWRYSLGTVGRHKLNKKFGLDLYDNQLTSLDLQAARNWLYRLRDGKEIIDDIDHFQNRRVRQSGELIQNQFENGVTRLRKLVRRKLRTPTFESLPFGLLRYPERGAPYTRAPLEFAASGLKSGQKNLSSTTFTRSPVELSRQALAGPFLRTFDSQELPPAFGGGGQKAKRRFVFDEICKSNAPETAGFVKLTRAIGTGVPLSDRAELLLGRAGTRATRSITSLIGRNGVPYTPVTPRRGVWGSEFPEAEQEGSYYERPDLDSNSTIAGVRTRQSKLSSGVEPQQPEVRSGGAPSQPKVRALTPLPALQDGRQARASKIAGCSAKLSSPPKGVKRSESEAEDVLCSANACESIKKSSLFSRANLWKIRESLCFYTRDNVQQIPQWQLRINARQTPFHYFIPRLLLTDRSGLLSKAWTRNLTDYKYNQADQPVGSLFSTKKGDLLASPSLSFATRKALLSEAEQPKDGSTEHLGFASQTKDVAKQRVYSVQSTQTVLEKHERLSILCTIERSVNKTTAPVPGFAFVKPTHSSLVLAGQAKLTPGKLWLVFSKTQQKGESSNERPKTSVDGRVAHLKSEPHFFETGTSFRQSYMVWRTQPFTSLLDPPTAEHGRAQLRRAGKIAGCSAKLSSPPKGGLSEHRDLLPGRGLSRRLSKNGLPLCLTTTSTKLAARKNRKPQKIEDFGRSKEDATLSFGTSRYARVRVSPNKVQVVGNVLSKTPCYGLSKNESKPTRFAKSVSLKQNSRGKAKNFRLLSGAEHAKAISVNRSFKQASELFSTKPINGALREFFGSNPLSQYMDQTNPLAELTHKRRISSLGIGGVSRESAGMAIRGIHPTHYGRICPIETPEGKNAGLVNSLALYARLNKHGFIETPYYKVIKGQVQEELGFSFYSALKETVDRLHLAPSDLQQSQANMLGVLDRAVNKMANFRRTSQTSSLCSSSSSSTSSSPKASKKARTSQKFGRKLEVRSSVRVPPKGVQLAADFTQDNSGCLVPVRVADTLLDVFKKVNPYEVDCIGISPVQILSVATSLIPFLEHNDANRALMGSNMQRQAVPLMISERPIVGTGLETLIAAESGQVIQASISGLVSHVSANKIVIERLFNTGAKNDLNQLSNVFLQTFPNRAIRTKKVGALMLSEVEYASQNRLRAKRIFAKAKLSFAETKARKVHVLLLSRRNNSLLSLQWSTPQIWLDSILSTCTVDPASGVIGNSSVPRVCDQTFLPGTKFRVRPQTPLRGVTGACSPSSSSSSLPLASKSKDVGTSLREVTGTKFRLPPSGVQRRLQRGPFQQRSTYLVTRSAPTSARTVTQSLPSLRALILRQSLNKNTLSTGFKSEAQNLHFCVAKLPERNSVHPRNPVLSRTLSKKGGCSPSLSKGGRRATGGLGKGSVELQFVNRKRGSATQRKSAWSLLPAKVDRSFDGTTLIEQEPDTRVLGPAGQPEVGFVKTSKNQQYVSPAGYRALSTQTLLRKAIWFSVTKYKNPKNRVLFSSLHQLYKTRPQQSRHKLPVFGLLSASDPALLTVRQLERRRPERSSVHPRNPVLSRTLSNRLPPEGRLRGTRVCKNRTESLAYSGLCSPSCSPLESKSKAVSTSHSPKASKSKRKFRRFQVSKLLAKVSIAKLLLGSPCRKARAQVATTSQFAGTFQQMTLLPFVHSLRSFTRSNQETCLTQKPLVKEGEWVQKGDILTDCSASEKGELAVGKNVMIAYLPWEGYNFEDAIVVSDRLTKEQIYASLHIERYVCEAQDIKEKITNSNEWFTRNLPGVNPKLVSHLDTFGFPKIGTILKEGDILVGKMRYFRNKPTTPYEKLLSDILGDGHFSVSLTSLRVPKGVHEARVISHRVVKTFRSSLESTFTGVSRPAGTPKMVHIFLGEKRSIQIGDKMSGRHGNKGIISTILPKQDMPYLPDGSPIDILLNPLGVPSRMNVGQIFESLLGLASTYLNQNFKITAFDELYGVEASQSLVYLKLYQARLQSGQNWLFQINFPGKTRLIDGRSGECFDQWVTVGRAYMLKLIHMVNEKIHARNTGPYALITQQPLRGRSQKGGQRLGEMEVWALEGYGAAYILQELLTKKSDDFAGRQEIINSLVVRSDKFSSPDNPSRDYSNPEDPYQRFSDPENPYQVIQETRLVLGHPEIFKTLICELQALCLDVGVYALKKESFQREYLGIVN